MASVVFETAFLVLEPAVLTMFIILDRSRNILDIELIGISTERSYRMLETLPKSKSLNVSTMLDATPLRKFIKV